MVKVSVWMRRKEARDQGGAQESDTNFPRRKNRDSIKGGEDENCTHTHYALCSAIWMKLLFTGLVTKTTARGVCCLSIRYLKVLLLESGDSARHVVKVHMKL